ncbi:MAG: hypothetical protein ACPGZP_00445 [Panacagrimonas sp.]
MARNDMTGVFVACLLMLSACTLPFGSPPPGSQDSVAEPVPGYVTDLRAFEAFIQTRPTPDAFRSRYPDVFLVLPGTITTKEFRTNNSRYFARLDEDGRIVGGSFG